MGWPDTLWLMGYQADQAGDPRHHAAQVAAAVALIGLNLRHPLPDAIAVGLGDRREDGENELADSASGDVAPEISTRSRMPASKLEEWLLKRPVRHPSGPTRPQRERRKA